LFSNEHEQYDSGQATREEKRRGGCGHVNAKFSSKTFKCAACGVIMDRDANGARNIFLKQIKC